MDIHGVISEIKNVLSFSNTTIPSTPAPLVLLSSSRPGMSVTKIVSEILAEKQKLGLPVGTLSNGEPNLDDIMIKVIVEKILKAITTDAKIQVAINPLGTVNSAGVAADGTPVSTVGSVVTIQTGGAVIN